MTTKLKVLIDGKEVSFQNDVKLIWDDQGEDGDQELHLCANDEGVSLTQFLVQNDSDETGLVVQDRTWLDPINLMGIVSWSDRAVMEILS